MADPKPKPQSPTATTMQGNTASLERAPCVDMSLSVGRIPGGDFDSKRWDIAITYRNAHGQLVTESKPLSKSSAIGAIGRFAAALVEFVCWGRVKL